jgi:hypothetical protein
MSIYFQPDYSGFLQKQSMAKDQLQQQLEKEREQNNFFLEQLSRCSLPADAALLEANKKVRSQYVCNELHRPLYFPRRDHLRQGGGDK